MKRRQPCEDLRERGQSLDHNWLGKFKEMQGNQGLELAVWVEEYWDMRLVSWLGF